MPPDGDTSPPNSDHIFASRFDETRHAGALPGLPFGIALAMVHKEDAVVWGRCRQCDLVKI